MFTGIIETIGTIKSLKRMGEDFQVEVQSSTFDFSDVKLGDSIATNGVCLTVVEKSEQSFKADVSNETISYTGFKHYQTGQLVNLEKAMLPTTRFGGHMVSGHVDGVGVVVDRYDDGRSIRIVIDAPEELAKYIAEKGSITIDGVSLTVNAVSAAQFVLNIVPHTAAETVINEYRQGCKVHLEVDLVARYLERLLTFENDNVSSSGDNSSNINLDFLANNGFLK